ncbi:MAG TPA: hypothetical protein PKV41_00140, partial [Candidatus Omnitrophota bacterium]|nr:hypothetical protein [Candidatus Omnitrophota bacterium]
LAMDRGMLHYDHPEHLLLGRSGRHNLFCPEDADGLAVRQHPSTTEGGILRSALQADGVLLLASDQSRTWAPGTVLSSLRRVISPDASLYLIADELETAEELTASFILIRGTTMFRPRLTAPKRLPRLSGRQPARTLSFSRQSRS